MCVKSVLIGLSAVNEHVIFDTFVIKTALAPGLGLKTTSIAGLSPYRSEFHLYFKTQNQQPSLNLRADGFWQI